MNRRQWITLAALAGLLILPAIAAACPACKLMLEDPANNAPADGIAQGGSLAGGVGGNMAAGYYYSILFMISVPFTLATILIFAIRREARLVPQDSSANE